jgi:8-oxo-dGTP pyrophosphatase MutT (NUDIX family)
MIQEKIWSQRFCTDLAALTPPELKKASVVLFILSLGAACGCIGPDRAVPCLILNKRSPQIRQGGDLCCPGGGISWGKDRVLAKLLLLTKTAKASWTTSRLCSKPDPKAGRVLNLLLAAGLREAWEEMRLNPLRFRFLGMLPPQRLVMFDRVIYPIVGWASCQKFTPNWEVERIIPISLARLVDPVHYGRFRPMVAPVNGGQGQPLRSADFPCFIHEEKDQSETLWGATYRITQDFLRMVFDFLPPAGDRLPLVERHLDQTYLNGAR